MNYYITITDCLNENINIRFWIDEFFSFRIGEEITIKINGGNVDDFINLEKIASDRHECKFEFNKNIVYYGYISDVKTHMIIYQSFIFTRTK